VTSQTATAQNSNVIIIIAVVLAAFVFIAAVAISFLVYRYKNKGKLKLKKPDFKAIAFRNDLTPCFAVNPNSPAVEMLEKLLLEPPYRLLLFLVSLVTPQEKDLFAKSVVHFFLYHQEEKFFDMMKALISDELSRSDTVGTLFRDNVPAIKTFVSFTKIYCLEYLWETLALPVNELVRLKKEQNKEDQSSILMASLELGTVDNLSDESTSAEIEANSYLVLLTLTNIFHRISKSYSRFPVYFINILKYVHEVVERKFGPEVANKVVGAFVFLRFIGPSLSAPHLYGLLSDPPDSASQKILILLTKMIQHLANETFPGERQIEFQKLDEFISNNLDKLHRFYDNVLNSEGSTASHPIKIPSVAYLNAVGWLFNFMCDNATKLKQNKMEFEQEIDFDLLKTPFKKE